MSISMCENVGVPSVSTIASAPRPRRPPVGDETPSVEHAREQLLRARLVERHAPRAQRLEPVGVLVDAEHGQPRVRERERERQADAAEPDDRDVVCHRPAG